MKEKELPKGYTCTGLECGRFNRFSLWVYAHWNEEITHECECGKINELKKGKLKSQKKELIKWQ